MLRRYVLLCLSLLPWSIGAQSTLSVTIEGNLTNRRLVSADSVGVLDVAGKATETLGKGAIDTSGAFQFQATLASPGMYLLAFGDHDNPKYLPLMLGRDRRIVIKTDAIDPVANAAVVEGAEAQEWLKLVRALGELRTQQGDSAEAKRMALLAAYSKQPGAVGVFARMFYFPAYATLPPGHGYQNERDYAIRGYFSTQELADPTLGYMAPVLNKAQTYVVLLAQMGMPSDSSLAAIQAVLNKTQSKRAQALLLQGFLDQAERDEVVYERLANRFIKDFGDYDVAETLKSRLAQISLLRNGNLAPDFSLPNRDGKAIALSSLRGKYVLIDFWASWCGPCRQENPNVVRLYQQYKDKRFDILGVSLDRNREDWLEAIQADNLAWNHVSDLKYWNSAAAQLYGVQSIPFTVLLDPEGRVVAKNLRGEELEAKLAELLGTN